MRLKEIIPIKKENKCNLKYTHIHQKSVGYMGYMCPECKHINLIHVAFKYTIKSPTKPVGFLNAEFEVTCDECNNTFDTPLIGIDPNICGVIETLNKLGYETEYSCEGHVYDDGNLSRPYILFAAGSTIIKDHGLPTGWDEEEEEDGRINMFYNEDVKYDNNGRTKQRALSLLENWVFSFAEEES